MKWLWGGRFRDTRQAQGVCAATVPTVDVAVTGLPPDDSVHPSHIAVHERQCAFELDAGPLLHVSTCPLGLLQLPSWEHP